MLPVIIVLDVQQKQVCICEDLGKHQRSGESCSLQRGMDSVLFTFFQKGCGEIRLYKDFSARQSDSSFGFLIEIHVFKHLFHDLIQLHHISYKCQRFSGTLGDAAFASGTVICTENQIVIFKIQAACRAFYLTQMTVETFFLVP